MNGPVLAIKFPKRYIVELCRNVMGPLFLAGTPIIHIMAIRSDLSSRQNPIGCGKSTKHGIRDSVPFPG